MGILVQREFMVSTDDRQEFERQSRLGLWEDQRDNGVRPLIFGSNPLGTGNNVVVIAAYRDISAWHEKARPRSGTAVSAWDKRAGTVETESTRLLMVQTPFGEPVKS